MKMILCTFYQNITYLVENNTDYLEKKKKMSSHPARDFYKKMYMPIVVNQTE